LNDQLPYDEPTPIGVEKPKHGRGQLRLEFLRRRIAESGFISVAKAAVELGVSQMTIRRDLARLENQNVVIRTHGGAIAKDGRRGQAMDLEEPVFEARARRNADAKSAIAKAAARILQPRQTVGLDVGSTALQLAHHLQDGDELKIFTNNLRAAMILSDNAHQVYIPGGQVRAKENSVFGSICAEQLRNFWLDHVFIGVSGITEDGCFDYSLEDTEIKRVYIERASNVVILCDSSKFDRMSLVQICELKDIDMLVTEAPPPPALAGILARAGVKLVVVE
jgi:DeoR/GlpR family transcriptional regulator of sugar metabolism